MSALYYTDENGNPLRPPRWWIGYGAGTVLTLLGIIIPCGGLTAMFVSYSPDRGASTQSPGTLHVSVDHPQRMVVWIEEPDDTLSGAISIPDDLTVAVTDPNGKPVSTRKPREELTSSTSDSERRAALVFAAAAAGDYTVAVTGTLSPQQSVMVSRDEQHKEAAFGLGAIVIVLLGGAMLLGGITTLIVTTVRHIKHPRLPA